MYIISFSVSKMFGLNTLTLFRTFKCLSLQPSLENNAINVFRAFSSLSINKHSAMTQNINLVPNVGFPCLATNNISTTATLLKAPAMKKRKGDQMVDRARDLRKTKRLQKALKKMSKKPRISRPLLEMEVDPLIFGGDMLEKRNRSLPELSSNELENKQENHALLVKDWSRFAGRRHTKELRQIDTVLINRQRALEELRKESYELYAKALTPETGIVSDSGIVYYQASGPNFTPPIRQNSEGDVNEDWLVDGHYEEATKKFEVKYGDTKSFMNKLLLSGNRIRKVKRQKERAEREEDYIASL